VIQTLSVETVPDDDELTAAKHSQEGGNLDEHEVAIMISLTGNFQAIREFVAGIKSARHNFRIDQIIFTPTSGTSDLLEVSLFLSYYYYN